MTRNKIAWGIISLAIVVVLWINFGVFINVSERGVRYNRFGDHSGVQDYILSPGITWRIPFLSEVQKFPVHEQTLELINNSMKNGRYDRRPVYVKLNNRTTAVDLRVRYQFVPGGILNYAKIYFGIPPEVIVDSAIRAAALNFMGNSIDGLYPLANNELYSAGIRITSLTDIRAEKARKQREEKKKKRMQQKNKKKKHPNKKHQKAKKAGKNKKQRRKTKKEKSSNKAAAKKMEKQKKQSTSNMLTSGNDKAFSKKGGKDVEKKRSIK